MTFSSFEKDGKLSRDSDRIIRSPGENTSGERRCLSRGITKLNKAEIEIDSFFYRRLSEAVEISVTNDICFAQDNRSQTHFPKFELKHREENNVTFRPKKSHVRKKRRWRGAKKKSRRNTMTKIIFCCRNLITRRTFFCCSRKKNEAKWLCNDSGDFFTVRPAIIFTHGLKSKMHHFARKEDRAKYSTNEAREWTKIIFFLRSRSESSAEKKPLNEKL